MGVAGKYNNVMCYDKALWIEDTQLPFYKGGSSEGSTLMKHKVTGKVNYNNPVTVQAIDLANWLVENVRGDDYCILKLILRVQSTKYWII